LVGGPARNDSFTDVRLDWSQTEVALDYNAPYQNLLAYQIMFSPNNPYYDPESTSTNPESTSTAINKSSALPSWGIALAVILPVLVILALFAALFIRRRRQKKQQEGEAGGDKLDHEEEQTVRQLGINEKASDSASTFVLDKKMTGTEHQASSSAATLGGNNSNAAAGKKEDL
jgi:flagellar biosynthesis/type III secretory pathway M-ring protein FliF/YscJ